MRILYILPYTPNLVRTRPYNLLRALQQRGHTVTLATLWENGDDREALREWEQRGVRVISARLTKIRSVWNSLRTLPTGMPVQSAYCWQPALTQLVSSELRAQASPFDVVHVEHLRGARYGLALKPHLSRLRIPIVWDSVDCISYLFRHAAHKSSHRFGRLLAHLELDRTERYEAWLLSQFDHILVTSEVDKRAFEGLRRAFPALCASSITVVPNGVDLGYFAANEVPRDADTLVFTGKMSYHANVTAAVHLLKEIMPHVWEKCPHVQVWIVGQNPPSELSHLAARVSPSTADGPRVTVVGSVPDIRSYLQRATIAVAPMTYGAGIQNKVLEAMACATPVVASPQAVAALRVLDEKHLLIAESAQDFSRQILRLLGDTQLQRRLGRAGRSYVEEHHLWTHIVEQLEEVYRESFASR